MKRHEYRIALLIAWGMSAFIGPAAWGQSLNKVSSTNDRSSRESDEWLKGSRLVGIMTLPEQQQIIVVVEDFRGDSVSATVWNPSTSQQASVELAAGELVGLRFWGNTCTQGGCSPVTYQIVNAAPDTISNTMPEHSSNQDVWLYELEFALGTDPEPNDFRNACMSTGNGQSGGLFFSGRWHADGTWSKGGYTFSCPDGVAAKCARAWGYKPWKTLDAGNFGPVSLHPLHLACVRAARADYCGDGTSHTRVGTLLDLADRYGFNVHDSNPGFRDEAAFGVDGAYWVEAPRWPTGRRKGNRWVFATCTRQISTPLIGVQPLLFARSTTLYGRGETKTNQRLQ